MTIGLRQTDAWVEIDVHNEGNPIAGRDQTGWGIGLTLVKGIVEAHAGTVRVESSQEHGTTFIIHLPLDSRPSSPPP